jgi:hypothetical protein
MPSKDAPSKDLKFTNSELTQFTLISELIFQILLNVLKHCCPVKDFLIKRRVAN